MALPSSRPSPPPSHQDARTPARAPVQLVPHHEGVSLLLHLHLRARVAVHVIALDAASAKGGGEDAPRVAIVDVALRDDGIGFVPDVDALQVIATDLGGLDPPAGAPRKLHRAKKSASVIQRGKRVGSGGAPWSKMCAVVL